jgi:hemolysin activation/secretion protein
VEQRQWRLQPAGAWALSQRTDLSFGPVFQYSTSDSLEGNFLSSSRPYGSGDFGQAGLGLSLIHDRRDRIAEPRSGVLLQMSGEWYPAIWDVESGFGTLGGAATTYYRIPVPLRPILVLRATGRKLFGEFPFHESAFIGGRSTVRVLELQRYAGDAALTGTTELRVPLGRVPVILPLDLGVYGFADAGRVWVDGESPDDWHAGFGGGLWVGVLNPTTALSLELGRYRGDSRVRIRAGLGF